MDLPSAFRFSCQRRFMANPPRWMASLDPVVADPMAFSDLEAPQRFAIMLMQRVCMFIMAGYSSASDMFLEIFSNISCSA